VRVTTNRRYDVNGNAKITVKWQTPDGARQKTVPSNPGFNAEETHAAAIADVLPEASDVTEREDLARFGHGGGVRVWNVSHP
jgi:predicted lipoprotein